MVRTMTTLEMRAEKDLIKLIATLLFLLFNTLPQFLTPYKIVFAKMYLLK